MHGHKPVYIGVASIIVWVISDAGAQQKEYFLTVLGVLVFVLSSGLETQVSQTVPHNFMDLYVCKF